MRLRDLLESIDNNLIELAVQRYGLTNNINEAGYILPDGRMLDLSGRAEQQDSYRRHGDQWKPKRGHDYMTGQRLTDHRDVWDILDGDYDSGTSAMYDFMRRTGAIRNMPGVGITVLTKPSARALSVAILGHQHAGTDPMFVDVVDPSGREHGEEFDISSRRGIDQIVRFIASTFGRKVDTK